MIAKGLLAGAAGTLALDLYTYADMLVRARPASVLPSEVTKRLAGIMNVDALAADDDDSAKNRRNGGGALFGYGVGLGAGVVYSAMRPAFRGWLPWPIAGVILGGATLVASEGSATALGATDWSTWSASDWVSDIVPRTLYGLTVAYVIERLNGDDDRDSVAVIDSMESMGRIEPIEPPEQVPVIEPFERTAPADAVDRGMPDANGAR